MAAGKKGVACSSAATRVFLLLVSRFVPQKLKDKLEFFREEDFGKRQKEARREHAASLRWDAIGAADEFRFACLDRP